MWPKYWKLFGWNIEYREETRNLGLDEDCSSDLFSRKNYKGTMDLMTSEMKMPRWLGSWLWSWGEEGEQGELE